AIAFVTDGIHWGTGDYRYMRNGMITATVIAALVLGSINITADDAFTYVWVATVLWIFIRSIFGVIRVWPGIGNAPIGNKNLEIARTG
ncbi:MAG: hypothetical protein WBC91_14870, partial [Phototrophicaceae bacterium]